MLEKGKISNISVVFLLMNVVGATAVVFLPAVAAKFADRNAWMTAVIATLSGVLAIFLVTELGRRFPGKTIIEYLDDILGNWLGKTIGVLYLFFFIHTNGIIIREFGELLASFIMPHTPLLVFHVSFVLLAAYAIRSGLEVISRVMVLTYPFVLTIYIALDLIAILKGDFNRLLPVLENGLKPVILGSLTPFAWRGEVIVFAMFLPFISEPKKGRFLGLLAVIFLALFQIFSTIATTMLFGPDTARLVFPTFTISNQALSSGLFDAAAIIVWLMGMLTKITQFYYAAVIGTAQLLKLKDYKPVVLPLGVILSALSILLIENSVRIPDYITNSWPPFASLFEWIIPLALLLIAISRNFKVKY